MIRYTPIIANPPPKIVDKAKGSPNNNTEDPTALIGTTYINDDVLCEPMFIVARKKIVVPNPNERDDITRKFIQKIQSKLKTFIIDDKGVIGNTIIIATK